MKNDRLKNLNYQISREQSFLDKLNQITPEAQVHICEIYCEFREDKDYLLEKLNEFILKYPKVPEFKALLSEVYMMNDEEQLAFAVIAWLEREHPDYLFGKISLASSLIWDGETEKVLEILGKDMEISQFCPERKEFHLIEVLKFNSVCVDYFLEVDNFIEAERRLALMEDIAEDHFLTQTARRYLWMDYARKHEENSGKAWY